MISYAEFFLFIGFIAAIGYALYWKHEAGKWHFLFKLMLTDKAAREEIISNFDEFKRTVG